MRFVGNCHAKASKQQTSSEPRLNILEVQRAETNWLVTIQVQHFVKEIADLKKGLGRKIYDRDHVHDLVCVSGHEQNSY